ncbi:hypothetical protein B5807_04501 [Epicoccum nigrum]|uniref:Uncharacterized protein n=1 Tax=Epicoccum nigrum TaxID=105696 RepID=A0A1Y2M3N5_EPING|nr:hypothetical protein B5807_04501 [Epicoccum nigrum]
MADFASFIKESREQKKKQALAQQFLGTRGRTATPTSGSGAKSRQIPEKPTLLSRISGGASIQKGRSSSAKPSGNIDGKWQHDLHKVNNPNGPPARAAKLGRTASASQIDRNSRTYDKFASVLSKNANGRSDSAPGFSIRGVASTGPFTVIASNFAPGTTASDIEAADGRTLYVYMKETPTSNALAHSRPPPAARADDMDVDGARGGSFQDGRFGFSEGGRREPPRGPRRRY